MDAATERQILNKAAEEVSVSSTPRQATLSSVSFEQDRKLVDLAGFAETANLWKRPGPADTVVIEQSGLFAFASGTQKVSRYIVVKEAAVSGLVSRKRSNSNSKTPASLEVVAPTARIDDVPLTAEFLADSCLSLPA